jgi:diacylglycerol kinase (ATP)
MTSAALIVNPRAGKGRVVDQAAAFAGELRSHGWLTHVNLCHSVTETIESARRAAQSADLVIACGGDGTVNTVLQGLVGTSAALGVLPCGTGNDIASTLGVPKGTPAVIAEALVAMPIVSVDIARVTTADGTARWYLGVLSTGFDSNVNERANSIRWPRGTARYITAMIAELRTFTPRPYSITIDGAVHEGPGILVSVGNGPQYGGGMRICPAADIRDGELDLTWLGDVSKATLLKVFPRVYAGTHITHPRVSTLRGRRIQMTAPGQIAYADGERVGPLPISIEVHPAALKVAAALA